MYEKLLRGRVDREYPNNPWPPVLLFLVFWFSVCFFLSCGIPCFWCFFLSSKDFGLNCHCNVGSGNGTPTKRGVCNANSETRRQTAARMTFWASNTWVAVEIYYQNSCLSRFSGVYLIFEVFQDAWRANKENPSVPISFWMVFLSYLVLQARISVCSISDKSSASLFLPCSQKMSLLTWKRGVTAIPCFLPPKQGQEKNRAQCFCESIVNLWYKWEALDRAMANLLVTFGL